MTTCSYDCARQAAEEFPQLPFAQVDTGMFSYGHSCHNLKGRKSFPLAGDNTY